LCGATAAPRSSASPMCWPLANIRASPTWPSRWKWPATLKTMHAVSSLKLCSMLPAAPTVLAVFWNAQIVRWGVWVGLVVLTVALLLLLRTRWGQSQPLGKCVVLSLLAHLLLAIYMTTVSIVTDTVGSPDGRGVQVALIDSSAAESLDPQPRSTEWNAVN